MPRVESPAVLRQGIAGRLVVLMNATVAAVIAVQAALLKVSAQNNQWSCVHWYNPAWSRLRQFFW